MCKKLVIFILLIMFLASCATTKTGTDISAQQLQSRIHDLEAELERKNKEIDSLENELDALEKVQTTNIYRKEEKAAARLSIKQIQKALKIAGFYKGPIDGKVGRKTREAIKNFQRAKGLKADGLVGTKTSKELRRYLTP